METSGRNTRCGIAVEHAGELSEPRGESSGGGGRRLDGVRRVGGGGCLRGGSRWKWKATMGGGKRTVAKQKVQVPCERMRISCSRLGLT